MGLINEVKQSILGKKTLYVIVYVQLSIVFFATIFASREIAHDIDYLQRIRAVVNPTWVKPRIHDLHKQKELENNSQLAEEIYAFFLSCSEVNMIGGLREQTDRRVNPGLDNILDNKPSKYITTMAVEKLFLGRLNDRIHSGRNLNEEDYNIEESYIPVLVSYNLRNKYKLGTIIKDKHEIDYKVVGVLKAKTVMPITGADFQTFGGINRNYIIIPERPFNGSELFGYDAGEYMDNIINIIAYNYYFGNIYIELKDENSISSFTRVVEDKSKEIGIPIEIESLQETTKASIRASLPYKLPFISVAVITIILSIIGQISVYLSLLLRKKREFGIRLACGSSLSRICKVIILEMLLIFIMALATSFAAVIAIDKSRLGYLPISEIIIAISPTAYMITLITAFIIFMVVSIVPILRIRKMEPTELIREV